MKFMNFDFELAGAHAVEAAAVADTVFTQVNSQARKPYAEVGISHAGSDGDGPGQAANQGGRSDVELGIEAISPAITAAIENAIGLAAEMVGADVVGHLTRAVGDGE